MPERIVQRMPAFHRFDPTSCRFPAPRVPVLPQVHSRSLTFRANALNTGTQWFRRGRYALTQAYRLAGLSHGTALLAPAYHCRTMLDPALALGADVLLYPMSADLAPDFSALRALVSQSGAAVKVLLLPHYFGFPQRLDDIPALCERHGICLIEDCSHMLAGAVYAGVPVPAGGKTGHYAVSSPYKFFPTPDGGLLWSNTSALPRQQLRSPGVAEEVRALVRIFMQAVSRHDAPDMDRFDDEFALVRAGPNEPAREWIESEKAPSKLYDPGEEAVASLAVSRWITKHTDLRRLAKLRRQNYLQWLQAMESLDGCRPLFPVLPEHCVPYMFPLLIEQSQNDFATLKGLGVPIWRWDEMAASNCEVAASYRLRLLHLPCHQELSPDDMIWMTTAVASVCGRPSRDRSANVH